MDGQIEREDFETGSASWLSGFAVEHGYDSLRRLDRIDLINPAASLLHRQAYTYDPQTGRLDTAKRLGDNSFSYGYNNTHNRISSVSVTGTAGAGNDLASGWSYDRLGRVTANYSFSETSSGYPFAESRSHSYNAANQREEVSIWRNSDFFADSSHWAYGYDFLGQVTSAKRYRDDVADTPLSGLDFEYAFDHIGNRTQTTTNGRIASYTPDTAGLNQYTRRDVPSAVDVLGVSEAPEVRVNGVTAATRINGYFYQELNAANSAFDNALSDKYRQVTVEEWDGTTKLSEESGHMYLAKDPEAFFYYGDGNLLTDGRWKYTWDAENRLIEVEEIRTDPTVTFFGKVLYDYDYMGRRVRRTEYERFGSDPYAQIDETRYFYSGWNVMAELDSSGGKTRAYLWGLDASGSFGGAGGVGGLLSLTRTVNQTETSYFLTYDANWNVAALINAGTMEAQVQYEYNAFGNMVVGVGDTELSPFRFSTKYQDSLTGLYYYGYRYYSPGMGRWLNRDPIGEEGGLNLYGFVNNDPVNQWDYLGLVTLDEAEASLRKQGVPCEHPAVHVDMWHVPGSYSDRQLFEEWLQLEGALGEWWTSLPECPRRLCVNDGRAMNPDESLWSDPNLGFIGRRFLARFHPGAVYEIRTLDGVRGAPSGNQCTYDDGGVMLPEGPAAGSADLFGPNNSGHFGDHQSHDVKPFNLAERLGRIGSYYEVRPVW